MIPTARNKGTLALTLAGLMSIFVIVPGEAKSTETGHVLTSGNADSFSTVPEVISPPFACGALSAHHLKALGPPKAGGSDCSFENTTIAAAYDPTEVINIPVVVHVVHKADGTGQLDEATVRSQITVLNSDFNAWNSTQGAEAQLYFFLASEDETGTPSTGVVYHSDDSLFDCVYPCTAMKEQLSALWDPNKYLNIYVVNGGAIGFRGWSTFAQNSQVQGTGADGVVIDWRVFGNNAPGVPYHLGHTTTHQVGHYLGLLHTFAPEPSGCPSGTGPPPADPSCYNDDGDLLCDTEPAFEATFDCSSPVIPCSSDKAPRVDVFGTTNFMNLPTTSVPMASPPNRSTGCAAASSTTGQASSTASRATSFLTGLKLETPPAGTQPKESEQDFKRPSRPRGNNWKEEADEKEHATPNHARPRGPLHHHAT